MFVLTASPAQVLSFIFIPSLFLASFLFLACYFFAKKQRLIALSLAVIGFIFIRHYFPLKVWMDGLGADSFEEAQSFDPTEAFHFTILLFKTLNPIDWRLALMGSIFTAIWSALLIAILFFFSAIIKKRHLFRKSLLIASLLFFAYPVYFHAEKLSHTYTSNSKTYQTIRDNYSNKASLLNYERIHEESLQVIVYIGESTSRLHWGLSGYPVNTTPKLARIQQTDDGLLTFNNVSSTHTHTSRSLLEALSFGLSGESPYQQSVDAKRASLSSVLEHLDINMRLLSTQRRSGAANYASTIIFSSIKDKQYAEDYSHLLGSAMSGVAVFDHEYFFNHDLLNQPNDNSQVTFLHSYAGHFLYHQNIPPNFHQELPNFFNAADSSNVYGSKITFKDLAATQTYDNAIRYIDSNLDQLISMIKNSEHPIALIYFSDHGESIDTGKTHDTAAYQIEMSQIPFLMYFNSAAKKAIPETYNEFKVAAEKDQLSTLAQLSPTVLRLLGYQVDGTEQQLLGIGLDEKEKLPPIVVRKTAKGISFINMDNNAVHSPEGTFDNTDMAMRLMLSRNKLHGNEDQPTLCYKNSNSFAKAVRGGMVADCLAITLGANTDDTVFIEPRNKQRVQDQWLFNSIIATAQSYSIPLWVNARQLSWEQTCSFISSHAHQLTVPVYIQVDAAMTQFSNCEKPMQQNLHFFADISLLDDSDLTQEKLNTITALWGDNFFTTLEQAENYKFPAQANIALQAEATQLPWQNTSKAAASILLINTEWDPNSR